MKKVLFSCIGLLIIIFIITFSLFTIFIESEKKQQLILNIQCSKLLGEPSYYKYYGYSKDACVSDTKAILVTINNQKVIPIINEAIK